MPEIIIENTEESGSRLDVFIHDRNPESSRSYIQKLISDGEITVNGRIQKSGYKIRLNDRIEVNFPSPIQEEILAENIPLDILFEDEHLIIINKQAGLVVHPAPGNYSKTLVNALLWHCKNLSGINGVLRPGIVHRLDKDTSGIMVAAKNDIAHQRLQNMWQMREVNRKYITLVHGIFEKNKFIVEAPIGRDPNDRLKMKVTDKNSRDAVTHFKVVENYKKYSLLEAKLDTGRTHQVRVHLAFIKHPVVGDSLYGYKSDRDIISRQALHSYYLGFEHPITKKNMEFKTDMPIDIKNAIDYIVKL